MKAATLRGPHKVGPRDVHTQQTPRSGPDNFGKEYCIPGFNESGQDRLFGIIYAEAAILLGDVTSLGDGSAWGSGWVLGKRGRGWSQGIPCCFHLTP